jgi:hypothetical protein
MTILRWLAVIALIAVLGAGAWFGYDYLQKRHGLENSLATPQAQVATGPTLADPRSDVVTVETDTAGLPTGGTPVAERSAVIGFLNKRNGASRDVVLKPGQATRLGDAVIRLRACEKTAPWEVEQYTGAFLQLDVRGTDDEWRRVFSGWTFKERPGLNVVQHPIYDVWVKSCTMSFPAIGPNTVAAGGGVAPTAKASSARKSPSTDAMPATSPPTEAPSAAPSNAM